MDTLWRISWPLKSPRPVWNGFMQEAHADGVYPGKSEVFFMPMIDMSSSDMTCIYSTLCFVSEQAFRYKVTPVITFDQPLYLKAQRGSTYNQLAEMYAEFVARKYKKATIVFDGYSTQQTTKAATHVRRHGTSVQVNFTGDMILQDTREKFLANPSNKQRFINLLSETLMKLGFQIHHAKDDADCLIVKTTLDVAASSTTVLIGEDTDLLVLLLYHVTDNLHGVYFMPSGRKAKLWDIKTTRAKIGTETCKRLLFAHAITGCDTTSRMMNIGKSLPVKLLRKSTLFQKIADVFMAASTHQEIEEAGEKAVVLLYGAACGHCRGETCVNVAPVNQDYEQDDEIDEEQ
ncbi:hypothetical protein ACOMHN_025573 [Nucella lapillus]